MITKEELEEWRQDIRQAENTPDSRFANAPFLRSLFKAVQEVSGVAQQIIHLSKSIDRTNNQLSELNTNIKKSSHSSDKYSKAMKYLTYALVFVGLAQVAVAYFTYMSEKSQMYTRKNCYQSVLQTLDIDLNYKNCLRSNGLTE